MNDKTNKVEGKIAQGLTEIHERALSLANQVKGADKLTAQHLAELKNIKNLVNALQEQYPSPKSGDASEDAVQEQEKAAEAAARQEWENAKKAVEELMGKVKEVTEKLTGSPPPPAPVPDQPPEPEWPGDLSPSPGESGDDSIDWGHST